jgi:hypothetical protein
VGDGREEVALVLREALRMDRLGDQHTVRSPINLDRGGEK